MEFDPRTPASRTKPVGLSRVTHTEDQMERYRRYDVEWPNHSGEPLPINRPALFSDARIVSATQVVREMLLDGATDPRLVTMLMALCRECGYRDLNPALTFGRDADDPRADRYAPNEALMAEMPQEEGFA